jgi:murein DD-endopeptidase MepM/ murein hydrolase activator NlpD
MAFMGSDSMRQEIDRPARLLSVAAIVGLLSAAALLSALAPSSAVAAKKLALALPWTQDQSWRYVGGPHSTLGCPDNGFICTTGKPWNSLDFSGGDGVVRAAASGTIESTTECPKKNSNFLIINHGGGWHTTYYHLIAIPADLIPGHPVEVGARLGKISTRVGCEGHADGPHVHFSVAHYTGHYSWRGGRVDLNGFQIGSWIFHDGRTQYSGCATNVATGKRVCPGELMKNDGALFQKCQPVSPVTSLKASGVACKRARAVVGGWGTTPACKPDGSVCKVEGFKCRVVDIGYTELDCSMGEQRIVGKLGPY